MPPSSSASFASNPFKYSEVLSDRAELVGRDEAIADIESHLFCESPRSVNLHGAMRLGKSSLLKYFETQAVNIAQAKHLGVWVVTGVSLKDAGCRTVGGFHRRLLRDLADQSVVRGNSAIADGVSKAIAAIDQDSTQDGRSLEQVLALLRDAGWRWLICLDDFEDAMDHPEEFGNDFYDGWRNRAQHYRVLLLVASRRDVEIYSHEKKITSDFFSILQKVSLSPLNRAAAETLLSCPWAGAGLNNEEKARVGLTNEEKKAALKWVKGYEPERLQKAGHYLWRARHEGKTIDWARQKFLEQTRPVKLPSEPQPGQGKEIFAAIVGPFKTVGQFVQWLAAKKDGIQSTLWGVVTVILLSCIAVGWLKPPQVQGVIKSVMDLLDRPSEPSNEK